MSHLERSVVIAAPAKAVWAVIADIGDVATWNPNVVSARCGPGAPGLGATRTCRLAPVGRIDEVVSRWVDGEELWFAVGRHGAIRSADMGLLLTKEPAAGRPTSTTVSAVADYHLAFGPLGPVIDNLTMKRLMGRMLDSALAGLKSHIEDRLKPSNPTDESEQRP